MEETVKVLVRVFDRGQNRDEVVDVPESAFRTRCGKTIAALMAAVYLEMPFTEVQRKAKFGLRLEDKLRLIEAAGETDPSTAAAVPLPCEQGRLGRETDFSAPVEMTEKETGGGLGSGRPTEKEEIRDAS